MRFGIISAMQHPNMVNLYRCCVEGDQLLLVYYFIIFKLDVFEIFLHRSKIDKCLCNDNFNLRGYEFLENNSFTRALFH